MDDKVMSGMMENGRLDEWMDGWMNEGLRSLSYTKYAQSHTKRKIYSLDYRIRGTDKKRVGHSMMWRALPPTLVQQRHPALAGILHGISCMIGRLEEWMKEYVNGCVELWNAGKMEWWNFLCVF